MTQTTQTGQTILGTAAQVAHLLSDDSVAGMYDTDGARLYHGLTRHESAEIEELLRLLTDVPGPLLELACGSGRLTVPFLKQGYDVTGLDLSVHMLDMLQARLAEPDAAGLSDHLTVVEGDMTSFSLGQKFGAVVLGASAVWNVDSDLRARMFKAVREHLNDGGHFLLTLIEFQGLEDRKEPFETTNTFAVTQSSPPALVTLFDYVDPVAAMRSTNIMMQPVVEGAVARTSLFTALTHLVATSSLLKELEASGFRLVGHHEVTSGYEILKSSPLPVRVALLDVTTA